MRYVFYVLFFIIGNSAHSMNKKASDLIISEEPNSKIAQSDRMPADINVKQINQITAKSNRRKQKNTTMNYRYRVTQTLGYLGLFLSILSSLEASDNCCTQAQIRDTMYNATGSVNPPQPQECTQSKIIPSSVQLILGAGGAAGVAFNDFFTGWIVDAWQKRKPDDSSTV